jgi:hypothetical protein
MIRMVRRLERRRRTTRRRALAASVAGSSGLLAIGLFFLPLVLAGPVGWLVLAALFVLPFVSMLTLVHGLGIPLSLA